MLFDCVICCPVVSAEQMLNMLFCGKCSCFEVFFDYIYSFISITKSKNICKQDGAKTVIRISCKRYLRWAKYNVLVLRSFEETWVFRKYKTTRESSQIYGEKERELSYVYEKVSDFFLKVFFT